jgi:hypothetical protein
MDTLIQKKSNAGRPRPRIEDEQTGSLSRLSMLRTTSTLGSFTPPINK